MAKWTITFEDKKDANGVPMVEAEWAVEGEPVETVDGVACHTPASVVAVTLSHMWDNGRFQATVEREAEQMYQELLSSNNSTKS